MQFRHIGNRARTLMTDHQSQSRSLCWRPRRHDSKTQLHPTDPKMHVDKVQNPNENAKHRGGGNGIGNRKDQCNKKNLDKRDLITDKDTKHKKWQVELGESFTKVFYFNQKKCQKK